MDVERQNEILKNYLQQYYDGFRVNNVVMTNENPLLRIEKMDTSEPINVISEKEGLKPMQEANQIVSETKKQKCFVVNH